MERRSSGSSSLSMLPLFVKKEDCHPSPMANDRTHRSSRTRSMREPSSASKRDRHIPWHRDFSPSPSRSRLFSSPITTEMEDRSVPVWSNRERRWSSINSHNRTSIGLASRLAEGASPYFRAGLDELRSIFDVDSDPIPISALDEDDAKNDEETSKSTAVISDDVSINLDSPILERKSFTSSPVDLDGAEPESGNNDGDVSLHKTSEMESSGTSVSLTREKSTGRSTARAEDGTSVEGSFSAAGLGIDRGILAWSLAFIAVGLITLCAYGYALHSDTFSITLIGFFLTQPSFALMGLSALVLRRRALMDLFSRAMRAHVLAQACIVLLAYLDLSASSFYLSSEATKGKSRARFQMVPSMEMRFGPVNSPIQAGDTPGINLLYSKGSSAASSGVDSSSAHAHDTHVGDFQSRLIHLIVFLVQAALPILAILIGQYMVAQRLAWLARRTSPSRQNSMNKQLEKSSPPPTNRHSTPRRPYKTRALPTLNTSTTTDRLPSWLAREPNVTPHLPSAPLPNGVRDRSLPRYGGHTRSISQPLDIVALSRSIELSNRFATEAPPHIVTPPTPS
ncbi:hypothetical protein CBS101457_006860 [Exobasidium rhododendri]|nr:hypothetical protein CBS101457_006860 [Exobasidium rhododendri]